MALRTVEQNRRMYGLIAKLKYIGYKKDKAGIVFAYFGDKRSTTKLTEEECEDFILWLGKKYKMLTGKMDKMRKKIIALMKHELGWSMNDIDQFCLHKGKFKKSLNLHTIRELPMLVTQFEMIHKREFKKL